MAVGVFSAFVKGHSAVAAQGSEWKAATKEPLVVTFADVQQQNTALKPVAPAEPVPAAATPATVVKTK